VLQNKHVIENPKILFSKSSSEQINIFLLETWDLEKYYRPYPRHGEPRRCDFRRIKVGNSAIFEKYSYILTSSQKTKNLINFLHNLLKSWLPDLSNEYIYAEQNPNRARDIGVQSWPFRSQKRPTVSLKFSLWRQVPGSWQVTRGIMLWLFLSWGIDCWIKSWKTRFGRITSWTFFHPISHCVMAGTRKNRAANGLYVLTFP
jgi:hypothetical protein